MMYHILVFGDGDGDGETEMNVDNRFEVGDEVYIVEREVVIQEGFCDHCGQRLPPNILPPRALLVEIEAVVIRQNDSSTTVCYDLSTGDVDVQEDLLFETEDEAWENYEE